MDKLRRAYGHRCFLHFCVVGEEDTIPPTAAAIEASPTAAFVAVSVGTVLSDCLKKIRIAAKVGYGATIYGLDPEVGSWITIEPEYMAYALQENEKLHFKVVRSPGKVAFVSISEEVDLSRDWARAVLQPFPYSIVELEGLRRALAEPLALPLPIGAATYSTLVPELAPLFVPSTSFRAEAISCHITAFMISKVMPGMSESLLQSIWDHAFCTLWMDLLSCLDLASIRFDRNVSDHSANSVRPDLMLWVLNRLCAKFEEKRDTLGKALQDLIKKICTLPPQYYGPVQWIIGVALARSDMAVWALRQGQQPDELSGLLSMTSQVDKASCLRLSVNFLRVALSLTSVYGKCLTYLPMPFTVLEPCTYGSREQITRRLQINYPRVVKEIQPWSEHVADGFTTREYVARAYAAAEESGSGCLVRGELELCRNDRYKVTLQPVGFEQFITNESELQAAIRDVVTGLQVLHAAGLVHRDVRWKNILNNGGTWMLIDLETVWECGCKPECSLRAWDKKTLVEGKYTERSDLYLVAMLMSVCPVLSQPGLAFQSKLAKHFFRNAEEVLADNYLK